MARNASEILIDTIHDWGVDVIFGLPGDRINGIIEAIRTKSDKVRFIHVRHEEGRGFYGLRLRQVHRQTRLLWPGHFRTGRHSTC